MNVRFWSSSRSSRFVLRRESFYIVELLSSVELRLSSVELSILVVYNISIRSKPSSFSFLYSECFIFFRQCCPFGGPDRADYFTVKSGHLSLQSGGIIGA